MTADVPTGFVVVQVRLTVQLLAPAPIMHEEGESVRVPDAPGVPGEAAKARSGAEPASPPRSSESIFPIANGVIERATMVLRASPASVAAKASCISAAT